MLKERARDTWDRQMKWKDKRERKNLMERYQENVEGEGDKQNI